MGRMSIKTGVYSNSFILKLWTERSALSEYERRGFFQFLYITACGNIEATIADYLKSVIGTPVLEMKLMERNGYPTRTVTINNEDFEISTKYERLAIKRIVDKALDDIDGAPIQKLQALHATIVGETIQEILGKDLYAHLAGLISVRNLLAHGRELYIETIYTGTPHLMEFAVSFEEHPLENAIKSLNRMGIYEESNYKGARNKDARDVIYSDLAVMHFWNSAVQMIKIYEARAETEKLHMLGLINMDTLA